MVYKLIILLSLVVVGLLCWMSSNNSSNNNDIQWIRENAEIGSSRRGRKASDIWDYFSKYFMVPFYISTEERVPSQVAKPKPKAQCNQCQKDDMSGMRNTFKNLCIIFQ